MQSGFDWTPMNEKWESLSEKERQPWYDIATQWLNLWKIQSPELFKYYTTNWVADLDSDGYHDLSSARSITI